MPQLVCSWIYLYNVWLSTYKCSCPCYFQLYFSSFLEYEHLNIHVLIGGITAQMDPNWSKSFRSKYIRHCAVKELKSDCFAFLRSIIYLPRHCSMLCAINQYKMYIMHVLCSLFLFILLLKIVWQLHLTWRYIGLQNDVQYFRVSKWWSVWAYFEYYFPCFPYWATSKLGILLKSTINMTWPYHLISIPPCGGRSTEHVPCFASRVRLLYKSYSVLGSEVTVLYQMNNGYKIKSLHFMSLI